MAEFKVMIDFIYHGEATIEADSAEIAAAMAMGASEEQLTQAVSKRSYATIGDAVREIVSVEEAV